MRSHRKKKLLIKKARALQTSTAKKIVKVVEALERVDEEGKEDPDFETVKEVLNELLQKQENLRSYDRSVMWITGVTYILQRKDTLKQCKPIGISWLNQSRQSR